MKKRKLFKLGFSLPEILLAVLVVIVIISKTVTFGIEKVQESSENTTISTLETLSQEFQNYVADVKSYNDGSDTYKKGRGELWPKAPSGVTGTVEHYMTKIVAPSFIGETDGTPSVSKFSKFGVKGMIVAHDSFVDECLEEYIGGKISGGTDPNINHVRDSFVIVFNNENGLTTDDAENKCTFSLVDKSGTFFYGNGTADSRDANPANTSNSQLADYVVNANKFGIVYINDKLLKNGPVYNFAVADKGTYYSTNSTDMKAKGVGSFAPLTIGATAASLTDYLAGKGTFTEAY